MPILWVTAVGREDCRYFPTAFSNDKFDVERPVWDTNGRILRWKDNIKDALKNVMWGSTIDSFGRGGVSEHSTQPSGFITAEELRYDLRD